MFALKNRDPNTAHRETYRPQDSSKQLARRDRLVNLRVALGALILLSGVALLTHALSTRSLPKTTSVLVAAEPLHRGEILVAADLRETTVAFSSPAVAATQEVPQHVLGRRLIVNVPADEVITRSMLSGATEKGPYRQAVISVSPSLLMGVTLVPGDRVDVLATYGSGASATTQAIATSLLVLQVNATSSSLSSTQSDTVTVALTSLLQGLAIAQAENVGKITLIPSTGLHPPRQLPIYPPLSIASPNPASTAG